MRSTGEATADSLSTQSCPFRNDTTCCHQSQKEESYDEANHTKMFKIGIMGKPVCCLWEGADLRGLVLRIITKTIWLLPQLLQFGKLYDALTHFCLCYLSQERSGRHLWTVPPAPL